MGAQAWRSSSFPFCSSSSELQIREDQTDILVEPGGWHCTPKETGARAGEEEWGISEAPQPLQNLRAGDRRGATPWLPALLQPTSPWGGHPAGGEVCGKELIPFLAASAPALPVCTARLAGAPATGLTHTHRLVPSWVDSKEPPPPLPWLCCPPPPPRSNACQLGLATTGALSWERAGWEMGPRDLAQKQVRVRGSQRKAKKVRQHESKGKRGPQPSISPQAL
ncbi:hypothetical protein GH733_011042 [Mirounga leonina]|nr:hypothetical protein GH733_011042 [Mirounga leonina]